MKYSVAAVSFLASVAAAATSGPAFGNTEWNVVEGQPFTITYSGCDSGCTILLKNGKSTDLKDYETLTTSATGTSFTVTLTDIPSDTYAFEIRDKSGNVNYSAQFTYSGTGTASTSAASSAATSTKAESTKAEKTSAASTTPSAKATTLTKITSTEAAISTPAANNNTTTPSASKTKASSTAAETTAAGTTSGSSSSSTASTVPNSGAARLSSSIALIAGAVAAMAYLN